MGKPSHGEEFDAVADAHDRADHALSPYHWLKKLPRGRLYRRVSLGDWLIVSLVCLPIIGCDVWTLPGVIRGGDDGVILIWLVGLAGLIGIPIVYFLQWRESVTHPQPEVEQNSRRKPKQPKRRKDWH